MIIHETKNNETRRLVQAAHTRCGDMDDYSLTVHATGLTDAGEPVSYTLLISRNELALMAGAAGLLDRQPHPRPRG